MEEPSEFKRLASCFAPTLGFFSGFFLGWLIHTVLASHSDSVILAVRLFDLIFGLIGWAVAVVISGKRIHCGGTQRSTATEKRRYNSLYVGASIFPVVMTVLLFKDWFLLYWIVSFFALACLGGEIGWGDPFKIFKRRGWE